MPPKPKFTTEEVLESALGLVRAGGMEALTARSLGGVLHSSPRPIFTLFEGGMDEVKARVMDMVRKEYNGYIARALKEQQAFKGVGTAYIAFAGEQPQFFRLLFMSPSSAKIGSVLPEFDENYEDILSSITQDYPDVTAADAPVLYKHIFLYTHGIATLIATRACAFSKEDISRMLTEAFTAFLAKARRKSA